MDTGTRAKTVIYIAGYGRSGSTLLERILASHPAVFGAGELANLGTVCRTPEARCSCGEAARDCPVWSRVVRDVDTRLDDEELRRLQLRHEGLAAGFGPWSMRAPDPRYVAHLRAIFASIFEAAGRNVSFVVDSSKTTRQTVNRPACLARDLPYDLRVIHLVRDPRACLWSNMRGSNRRLERGVGASLPLVGTRTSLSWLLANAAADALATSSGKVPSVRVRYEDLVTKPVEVLKRIERFLEIDLMTQRRVLESHESIPGGHQLAGNRLRSQSDVVLRPDLEWTNSLSRWRRRLIWLVDGPLARRYGYRWDESQ